MRLCRKITVKRKTRITLTIGLSLSMAMTACTNSSELTVPNVDGRDQDERQLTNGGHSSPKGRDNSREGYAAGKIILADQQGGRDLEMDFVFIRTQDVAFFQWRPRDVKTPWSFQLYSHRYDRTVFGDLDETRTVVDSRQAPRDGLPKGEWVGKLFVYLDGVPAKHWKARLAKIRDGIEITVSDNRPTLPGRFSDAPWHCIYSSVLRHYQHFMDRTIDK